MSAVLKTVGEHEASIFEYRGALYPSYLKHGNAQRFIEPIAKQFCRGIGLDIGAGDWPLKGARPIDLKNGGDAMALPEGKWDYIFSSHCLEHLPNPVAAIEHWTTRLRAGGVLFLYLPHHSQKYWRPQNCRKHLHLFHPEDVADMLRDLGFVNVLHSERDLAWSFAVVGWNGEPE
jgi:SAM-dependent methyltransferase